MTEPDSNNVVDTQAAPYTEEGSDFVPDATDAMGTLDTSGTAGGAHEDINAITPVFEAAKAQDLQYAAGVVSGDIDDPGAVVNEGAAVTVTTAGGRTPEAGEEAVLKAAEGFEKEPVKVEDPSLEASEKAADAASKTDSATTAAKVEGAQAGTLGTGTAKVQSDDAAQRSSKKK